MNEMLFLAIVITVIVLVKIDEVRFNIQVNRFIDRADEILIMYEIAVKELKNEESLEFQGKIFYLYVKEGDYKSFIEQVELAICEVFDKYNLIDKRYFSEMDEELAYELENLHKNVEEIQKKIRIEKWKNGWN